MVEAIFHRSISPVRRSNDVQTTSATILLFLHSTNDGDRKMTFHSTKHDVERLKTIHGGRASRLVVRSVAFGRSWRRSEVDTVFRGSPSVSLVSRHQRVSFAMATRRFHHDDDDIAVRRSAWIPKNQSPYWSVCPITRPAARSRFASVGHTIEIIIIPPIHYYADPATNRDTDVV